MISNDVLYKQVESNINKLVKDNVSWSVPVLLGTHYNISICIRKYF